MKRLLIALLIIVLLGLAIGGYFYFRNEKPSNILTLYGNVDVRLVDIGFRVSGQVSALMFEEGDYVPKGSLMATLDKDPYTSQVNQSVSSAESLRVSMKNAEVLLKRRQELIGIEGVSQEELDNANSSYYQLKANLAAAEASEQVARDNLSFTQAFAPTNGIILTRIREPGTVVREGDPVYTLSVISPVWIRAFINEPNLGFIYYGMPAEIYTDKENGKVYTGRVGFISPVAEFTPKTVETTQLRTDLVYRLRIYADNPDQFLKQGMPVTVRLKKEPSIPKQREELEFGLRQNPGFDRL
jgi:HlyD family secretion protein